MTWELAENLDIDKYSALIAVGGDGTYHEVVNGMLHRKDKKRIPVGFLPNGSGNDTLRAFGVLDIAKGLDYIAKGDIIKVDLVKVLMDYTSEDQITSKEDRLAKYRYQLVNSSFNVPAKLNRRASGWKWCCCANPYEVAAVIEFTKLIYEPIDIYVDDSP
jgi:diacylglycerol kinase family enzyme